MHDVIVIGAGLFGAITAAALRVDGHKVLVIDARHEEAGSRPAACLMKPSWFSSLGKANTDASLELLDDLYGVHDLQLRVGPRLATVHWCDPRDILGKAMTVHDTVVRIEGGLVARGVGCHRVVCATGAVYEAKRVVVAAGVWTNALAPLRPVPGLVGRAGVAFRWSGFQLPEGFIRPWAPYRQTVGFNIAPDTVWVGDGSAIKPENWGQARLDASYERCASAVGRLGLGDLESGKAEARYGIRPYVPDAKPCYLEEHMPGIWVNTGGAKNGTVAAGWAASQLRKAFT